MPLEWKTVKDADGNDCIVMKDGNPVHIASGAGQGGKVDKIFDAQASVDAVKAISQKRDDEWLPAIATAKEELTPWVDLGVTAEEAKTALTTVKDLPEAKALDAAKLDEARLAGAKEADEKWETKQTEWETTTGKQSERIRELSVGRMFSSAEIREVAKQTIYGENGGALLLSEFGAHFKDEGGDAPIAYHKDTESGAYDKKVLSETSSDPATNAEALTILINKHPQAKQIWLAEGASGTGGPKVKLFGGEDETVDKSTAALEKMPMSEYRAVREKQQKAAGRTI